VQTLSKGANAPLPSDTVTVQVTCSSPVDVSALLVTAGGRVRSDDDMIFYNQPQGPGVRYAADGLTITTGQVPADIDKVVITASLDSGGPFGTAGSVTAVVKDGGGSPAVDFPIGGLGSEKALICVEVYRRGADWKVRAVGQGYDNGLAGIATDFGITVDDEPVAAPPPPGASSGFAPPSGPPSNLAPPVALPPTPAAAPASGGRVNLDKGRVSLQKRQTVSLVKTGAPALRTVRMGLGWDPAKRGADVDLDAALIAFDANGKDVEKVWYGNLNGFKGAIVHSGDNLTGEGAGDDEVITIRLDQVPANVSVLVFTVNSFRGQKFTELKTAYARLLDEGGAELVRYDLGEGEPKTGVLMCLMRREADGTWSMTALGEFHDGRNVKKMVDPARLATQRH
jgi:stress response protein SCP2